MKNLKKDNKGFSLVELLVVIAIMVVLVGVVAPTLLTNIEKSRESKDIQNLDAVAGAIQAALAEEKAYEAVDNKIHEVDDIINAASTNELAKAVTGYLATKPVMSGKAAKDTSTYKMYYVYTKSGQICVFLASGTVATGDIENADAISSFLTTPTTKNASYKVVR